MRCKGEKLQVLGYMSPSQITEYLRAKAKRCRELAQSASDQEAAAALRQMAEDMETAVIALDSSASKDRDEDVLGRRASA